MKTSDEIQEITEQIHKVSVHNITSPEKSQALFECIENRVIKAYTLGLRDGETVER